MDDFYQFMSPLEGANNNANDRPSTKPAEDKESTTTTNDPAISPSSPTTTTTSSRASWSNWGASFNKLIERGKKDMNEFVDVTRKDLTELAHTVQQERTTALEALTKRVEVIKTTLPPIPASVNTTSADILGKVSSVMGGLKHELTEIGNTIIEDPEEDAATDASAPPPPLSQEQQQQQQQKEGEEGATTQKEAKGEGADGSESNNPEGEKDAPKEAESIPATTTTSRGEKSSTLSFASTASLFTAGATSFTQSLTHSTKEFSTTANELFKKTLPAAAEKHLGEADVFLKSTTETIKSNGLIAEQYVNKFGAGMANFLNNAVVVSAPEKGEAPARTKKMFFDRKAAMLEKLRMDSETYTIDPMTTIADDDVIGLQRYKYFLQNFNMGEYQQRNTKMLTEYPEMKALMAKLIPLEVDDEEMFWQRYYFRLFEIEEEEKRRKKLVQEAGADLSEEDFTWDDNDDDEEAESSGGQGSVTPKADKKESDTVTPRASQILSGKSPSNIKQEPLTAEALASSLSKLPIPSESTTGDKGAQSGSDDEWGSESLKSTTKSSGSHSKTSTTNMSSSRTSEDAFEVVSGTETPVGAPVASVTSVSSAASSPAPEQTAQQSSKLKPTDGKEEDDWSDWE
ncbi:hypothetical protein BGZ76_008717 [Entomortierella beljakovae]|nr:hypothetical protein BGZ76_008717 [Entomortierella beljakovae]